MILRLTLGIALGLKIAQDSLLSWHTVQMVLFAGIVQVADYVLNPPRD